MAIDYDYLMALPPRETLHTYTQRDTLLYALGIGAGQDPEHYADDLPFVFEQQLQVLPTMAVALAYPGFWQMEPQYGIDWQRVLHIEQSIEIHRTLPAAGAVRGELTIDEIIDKGKEKGAILASSRRIYDQASGQHLATVRAASMLRGDGGFSGKPPVESKPAHKLPERAPDLELALTTRTEQALIYRLSGDYNPLHVDPAVAERGGFPTPILHGMCTYGVAGRAAVRALCGNNASRLRKFGARFSSPTYPGETIVTEIWRDSEGKASFRARARERDVVVLNGGYAEFD